MTADVRPFPPCWCNGLLPHDHAEQVGYCGPVDLMALYRPRLGVWGRLRQLVRGER